MSNLEKKNLDVQKWTIGDIKITSVLDTEIEPELLQSVIPNLTPEAVKEIPWLYPNYADEEGNVKGAVQAFIIEAGDLRIMVDTCIGDGKNLDFILPMWSRLQNAFVQKLDAAGFSPDSIDIVVCTHLHADHVGWNTMYVDGKWVPTFPKARYLIGRHEFQTTQFEMGTDESGSLELDPVYTESILPVFRAGLVDLVERDHQVCDGVRLTPSPGHTLGHVSIMIESDGASAMITGDFLHHPAQIPNPHWGSGFDADAELANETRKRLIDELTDSSVFIIGTHFARPAGGYAVRLKDGVRFDPGASSSAEPKVLLK